MFDNGKTEKCFHFTMIGSGKGPNAFGYLPLLFVKGWKLFGGSPLSNFTRK